MQNTAFITGCDRGLGFALCSGLLDRGWHVFAGQFMPDWPDLAGLAKKYNENLYIIHLDVSLDESVRESLKQVAEKTEKIDLLINNAGVISPAMYRSIREPQDYAEMHRLFDVNTLGPLRVVEASLPLMDRSTIKRLCFVSSEAGSIGKSHRSGWFSYCMSKTALNMAVKNLYNQLRPEGYTFRLYHPGWIRSYMSGKKNHEADLEPEEAAEKALGFFLEPRDEDQLALFDYQGNQWSW